MSVNLNDITILNNRDFNYLCIINEINKRKAINLFKNADLSKKRGSLKNIIFLYRLYGQRIYNI